MDDVNCVLMESPLATRITAKGDVQLEAPVVVLSTPSELQTSHRGRSARRHDQSHRCCRNHNGCDRTQSDIQPPSSLVKRLGRIVKNGVCLELITTQHPLCAQDIKLIGQGHAGAPATSLGEAALLSGVSGVGVRTGESMGSENMTSEEKLRNIYDPTSIAIDVVFGASFVYQADPSSPKTILSLPRFWPFTLGLTSYSL